MTITQGWNKAIPSHDSAAQVKATSTGYVQGTAWSECSEGWGDQGMTSQGPPGPGHTGPRVRAEQRGLAWSGDTGGLERMCKQKCPIAQVGLQQLPCRRKRLKACSLWRLLPVWWNSKSLNEGWEWSSQQTTPVFLPGEFHGQRCLGVAESNTTKQLNMHAQGSKMSLGNAKRDELYLINY